MNRYDNKKFFFNKKVITMTGPILQDQPPKDTEIAITPPTPSTPLMQGLNVQPSASSKITSNVVTAQAAAGAVSTASSISNTYVAAMLEATDWPIWQQLLLVGAVGALAYILSALTSKGVSRCLSKKPPQKVLEQTEVSATQKARQIATHTVGAVLNGGAQVGARFALDASLSKDLPLPIIFLIMAGCGLVGYALSATTKRGLDQCANSLRDTQEAQPTTTENSATPTNKIIPKTPGTPWSARRIQSAELFGSQVYDPEIGTPDSRGFADVLWTPETHTGTPSVSSLYASSDERQQPERSCCLL
jgi:hypothetical protein